MVFGMVASGCAGADGAAWTACDEGTSGVTGATGAAGAIKAIGATGPVKPPRLLDDHIPGWLATPRTKINQMLADYGVASATFNPKKRPVAVFDWDNTVIKNDIGDGTMFWMMTNNKYRKPADWEAFNAYFTADAVTALKTACGETTATGVFLDTAPGTACGAEVFNIYYNEKTAAGLAAWKAGSYVNHMWQSWIFPAQLQWGYTIDEIRTFAMYAWLENLAHPVGATQLVGNNVSQPGYIRVYDQIRDLIETLQDNAFDVWVVSASPQGNVEWAASQVGIPADHVVGIRMVTDALGRLTVNGQGCGPYADGKNGDSKIMPFSVGKRCWMNKVIFHVDGAAQFDRQTDLSLRPIFVAGDSDGDIGMMKDAIGVRLAINRNKTELMCNAYANTEGKWVINPMFIAPKAAKPSTYPCTTARDPNGEAIVDQDGHVFPADLDDTIFALP